MLGESRRSMMSNQSAIEQIQARRKFTAVKELPQMPVVKPPVIKPVPQEQMITVTQKEEEANLEK